MLLTHIEQYVDVARGFSLANEATLKGRATRGFLEMVRQR